jgi:4-amino-4-deoxy-L-arabinose transferase-like glycosyltransferase
MKRIPISPEWLLIIALAIFKLMIHFLTNTNYELHRDAYLYLALADHPDWGYVSVPPFVAMLGRFTMSVFGDSVFAIRLFPALVGAASIIVIALIVKELGGKMWTLAIAGLAFILSPAFLRSNTLFQPVSFDQFFWLLSGYIAVKLVQTQNPKYWIHLSVVWGLAFLNKYAIVFFALAFFVALALTPDRKLFLSKYFLIGLLLGFLIILPNLIWQYNHNWPVVAHVAELRRTQLVNVRVSDFMLLQFLMNLHALLVWLFGLVFLLFLKDGRQFRVLGLTYVAVLVILILLSGKHYYTLGMYTILFAAGGVAMERLFVRKAGFLKPAILALMILIALPVIPYSLPVLPMDQMAVYAQESKKFGLAAALMWEDGRIHSLPQDYADMTGWQELAEIVIKTYNGLSEEEKSRCAIYAENYGQAGAIKYYGRKHGLPEPVCFNETFVLWAPDSTSITTLIYVNHELGEDIQHLFSEIQQVGEITNPHARESGLPVFLCRHPNEELAEFYQERVGLLKSRYR